MNILDENVSIPQRQILTDWRIPVRHIGHGMGRKGMKDDEIIPFLLTLHRPSFFTLDWDYFKRGLCHARYCLVFLDVRRDESATFIRRVLRHSEFDTHSKRSGKVMRASHSGLDVWHLHADHREHFEWTG